jgi:DNA-binding PadR family transcriptional regulator
MSTGRIRQALDLCHSTAEEFLDSLVDLDMLESFVKEKDGRSRKYYRNTPAGVSFLDCKKPEYVGGAHELHSRRIYGHWANLLDSLRTGESQTDYSTAREYWERITQDPSSLEDIVSGMRGISHGPLEVFARGDPMIDFSKYNSLCDLGGASGQLACYVAQSHPHIRAVTTDLPPMLPHAQRWIERHGCTGQVVPVIHDFGVEELPEADIITMAMVLNSLNLAKKKELIRRAYDALPDGGVFVSIETIIDDERRLNTDGLCTSLLMLVIYSSNAGFEFTGKDITGWCKEAGFKRTEVFHLMGPTSAAISYK